MGDVTHLNGEDSAIVGYVDGVAKYDPNKVLENCIEQNLADVLVIGWDQEGYLFVAGSLHKTSEVVLLLELVKHKILDGDYELA